MLVVSDIDDVFLPKPNDLLVNLTESRAALEALLGKLNDMFVENHVVGSALGPALQAGFKLMVGLIFTPSYPKASADLHIVSYWWQNCCLNRQFTKRWCWCSEEQRGSKNPWNRKGRSHGVLQE